MGISAIMSAISISLGIACEVLLLFVFVMLHHSFCLLTFVVSAAAQAYIAFDTAAASSVYSAGSFAAEEAISPGSGYWCRFVFQITSRVSGVHLFGLHFCVQLWAAWPIRVLDGYLGLTLQGGGCKDYLAHLSLPDASCFFVDAEVCVCVCVACLCVYVCVCVGCLAFLRAYGPGEFKVLTSGDGGNFEEAACWQKSSRSEVSYEQSVLFDVPLNVKALTIVMRSPMPWSYFGISDVSLLAAPSFPSMLVSGAGSAGGEEMCIVAQGSVVAMAPCLSAVAAGDGADVFEFSDGALRNVVSKSCITLANGDAAEGKMVMAACPEETGDGRGIFELTYKGQLKLGVGDYCLTSSGSALLVQDCAKAEAGVGSKFFQAGVGSFDPSAASAVRSGAGLLKAAAERQAGLLAKLQDAMPKLNGCKLALAKRGNASGSIVSSFTVMGGTSKLFEGDSAADAVARIFGAFGVDKGAVTAVISASASALGKAAAA